MSGGAFAQAAEVIFADPNMALEASFQPVAGGAAIPLRVILSRPVAVALGLGAAVAPQVEASVLMAALPGPPRRGDLLTVGGATYRVERAEREGAETSWRLTLATT